VHCIAWLLHYGNWPQSEIDHINLIKIDNRICNLREATRQQNVWNSPLRSDNTTGYKGVTATKSGKFEAGIKVNGKKKHLGTFDTELAAHAAYCAEVERRSGKFARLS
jgi:HNH endonuclease